MLLQPPTGNRWGNSLAGAIPAAVFAGGIGAFVSPTTPTIVAVGALLLVAAFIVLAVRSFRMRVQTAPGQMVIHGMLRTRTIAKAAIVSIDTTWSSYAAVLTVASGVSVPSVRWRDENGRIRTTPIWALAVGLYEWHRWRQQKALMVQQLQIWAHADERFVPR